MATTRTFTVPPTTPATPFGCRPVRAPRPVVSPRALTHAWRSGVQVAGWDSRRDAKRLARLAIAERSAPEATF